MNLEPLVQPDGETLTLGEILGAALSRIETDAEAEARLAERARWHAAWELADQLAPLFSVEAGEVFDALCRVPEEMLSLLETPEGWAVLAGHIAPRFHLPVVTYHPTIH